MRRGILRRVAAGLVSAMAVTMAAHAATDDTDLEAIHAKLRVVAAPWCGKLADFDAQGTRVCTIRTEPLDAAGVTNAFALFSGTFVTREMQARLSRDELAMVLGHEFAHLVLAHGYVRLQRQREGQAGRYDDGLLGLLQTNHPTPHDDTPRDERQQELDADTLGLVFAGLAGYDIRGAVAFWRDADRRLPALATQGRKTHPSAAVRLRNARAAVAQFCGAVAAGKPPLPRLERLQPAYEASRDEVATVADRATLDAACGRTR
ncbi:M48 family metalloprotease [Roseateles chitosanitabidus]|uniref:M48 family metalloprotease n=1 Tax=Roseateles chitosanitabidus TaxID=65048 RepID=UPI001470C18C|nr:M48 family metalloprotease [Roseateles chitosanitabidus]